MTPGPREPTAEQLQNYLEIVVKDLKNLYDTGIQVKPPEHPEGRYLALVC